jgi:hypothetical protein
MQILFRIDHGKVGKIRPISGDCQIDADGLPLRWIDNITCGRLRAWRCWRH